MKDPVDFEIEGRKFTYSPMKLREQMKIWPKLAKDIGPLLPVLGQLQSADDDGLGGIAKLVEAAAPILENAEHYLDVFGARITTEWDGKPVKLKPFEEQIVTSPKIAVVLIAKSIQAEFGDFLQGLGVTGAQ